jgi:RNA polymerase sigma-70 factor (ECF subfamily)
VDLEQIFRAHQKEIFVYFLRTLGDRDRAEDLAQETFLRACGSALRFRGDSSVRTWVFSIARRVLVDHYRRRAPEVLTEPPEQPRPTDPGARIDVERALALLPVAAREAIVMVDVIGLSPSEAADAIGATPNAFRVRLHRARQQFREVYGDER